MSDRNHYKQSPSRNKRHYGSKSPETKSRDPQLRSRGWNDREGPLLSRRGEAGSSSRERGHGGQASSSQGVQTSHLRGRESHDGHSGSKYRDPRSNSKHRYRSDASSKPRATEVTPSERVREVQPRAPKKFKPALDESTDDSTENGTSVEYHGREENLDFVGLKAKLKKRELELGSKEAQLAALKDDLDESKAEKDLYLAEIRNLKKRKDKEGTLKIVRNLESKNAKMSDSKEKLQVQVDVLNDANTELEGQLLEKNEELLKFKKKEKVAKMSIGHLQKDLLTATNNLKAARGELGKLKSEIKMLEEDKVEENDVTEIDGACINEEDEGKVSTKEKIDSDDATIDSDDSTDDTKESLVGQTLPPSPVAETTENPTTISGVKPLKDSENFDNDSDESQNTDESQDSSSFIIRKPASKDEKRGKTGEEKDDLIELAADDSFLHPPTSSFKLGKNLIKNYEKRSVRDALPPRPLRSNSSNNNTVTIFNQRIGFQAARNSTKTPHNSDEFGTKVCGLHPYCSNKWSGGEDIGLAFVVSPDFHPSFEDNCWVCWEHVAASLAGMEVQTQEKVPISSTPKNSRTRRAGTKLTNAPMKKSSKKPKLEEESKASEAEKSDKK